MKGIVEGEKNYIKFERKIDSKKGERERVSSRLPVFEFRDVERRRSWTRYSSRLGT